MAAALPALASSYKCKAADGKTEYSDRPCVSEKLNTQKPTDPAAKAPPTSMEKLTALFAEYEAPLCERELLAAELEKQSRATAEKRAALKPKYDRLTELAETQLVFQSRASKITQAAGSDGAEGVALRRFQSRIKLCTTVPLTVAPTTVAPIVAPTNPAATRAPIGVPASPAVAKPAAAPAK